MRRALVAAHPPSRHKEGLLPSLVYYAPLRQTRLEANETLPIKLDLIIVKLGIRDRVKGEIVAIKMHLGSNVGYSTLHPVFVRRVVEDVKDGGGRRFVVEARPLSNRKSCYAFSRCVTRVITSSALDSIGLSVTSTIAKPCFRQNRCTSSTSS